jgi:hypothetical protein
MYRYALVATAIGCLLGIVSLARSADHHGHFHANHLSGHLRATPNGKVSHGTIRGHTVHTHHGKGRVRSVTVGSRGHSRAHKVTGTHRNSSRTHAALESGPDWQRHFAFAQPADQEVDLSHVSARLPGAASYVCFVISFDGNNYIICIPISLVDLSAVAISGSAPDGLDAGD